LIDDLDQNGYLDLLVTTMNGNTFAMQTMVPYESSLAWTEQNQCSRNGATWRHGYHGIHVAQTSRIIRDVTGASVHLQFEIVVRPCHLYFFCPLVAATGLHRIQMIVTPPARACA
jgi:hypothetical protein